MKKRAKLQAQHETIVQMASEGRLLKEIAEVTGSVPGSIGKYIRKHQIDYTPDRSLWAERPSACTRNHDLVVQMAREGATLSAIGDAVGTTKNRVRDYLTRHSIPRPAWRESQGDNPMSRPVGGHLNPSWKGGRMIDKDGYVLLWKPDHHQANRHGYIREHRLVMESMIGRPLTREEVVHHRNDVRDDNRPENLQLFSTNGEHLSVTLTGQKSRESRGLPPSTRRKS